MPAADRPQASPYTHGTVLRPADGGFVVHPPLAAPGAADMLWLADGMGGWIGRGGCIEGQFWLVDEEGGFFGLGPGIDGLRWRRSGGGGFVGIDGIIRGLHQHPDGTGGYVAQATATGGVDRQAKLELEFIQADGPWGGPVFRYRGAELRANAAMNRWQVWIDHHPLRGVTLRRLGRAIEIVDAWIDGRVLPPA